jgi:hypothetical protein
MTQLTTPEGPGSAAGAPHLPDGFAGTFSLEPCSTPGTTVWIIDVGDATGTSYFPLVNGSTTDFAHPFGMVMPVNPAHALFPRILVQHLIGNPTDVPADQLWGSTTGVVS